VALKAYFFYNLHQQTPCYKMKKYLKYIGFLILIIVGYFGYDTYQKLDLISGFSAKSVASCHFIDNRNLIYIQKNDNDINLIDLAKNKISESEKYASASVYGLKTRKAIYRDGLGSTLIVGDFDASKPFYLPKRTVIKNNLAFPYGHQEPKDTVFKNIDYNLLKSTVENAFDTKNQNLKRSRAVLVIYKNKIIAEKYADGFNYKSMLLGWSMTKSLTATYFGILQKQSKFDINKPAPFYEWHDNDRKVITTNDLLHMNSGLEWEEDYGKISDVTKMLFLSPDMTQSQLVKKLVGKPNQTWNYSSGTTNLLTKIISYQFKTQQECTDFWYTSLIDRIGMNSMIVEQDMAGNFVGSSYGWATARDWAKFGLLYLHKGNWNGDQVFDESWEKYVRTPTNTSNGKYGAHFWLNQDQYFKDAPKEMYSCSGYQGQKILIFPNHDLVIVRFGLKEAEQGFDFNGLIKGILKSIKQ
jgi:CubicO group peptidase (beta-lactamase class C family)